jgi:hypothetical protein
MIQRFHRAMSLMAVLLLASGALVLWVSESETEEVLLKYKATVIEETKDYIVIKFEKRDIGLVTEKDKPLGALATQRSTDKETLTKEPSEQALLKTELKNEILQELRGEIQKEVTKGIGPIEYGSVEGRILRRRVGEPEVRVKLVRWVEEASVLGIFKELKKGAEFETTTDKEGRYAFHEVPVGNFQLKWLPRGSDAWIRRLSEKPDVRVVKGKTTTAPAVELSKPVLP